MTRRHQQHANHTMTISSLWTSRVTPAAPSRTGDARPAHGKVLTKGMTTAETSRSPPAEPAVTKSNATPTRLPRAAQASQPKQHVDLPEHPLPEMENSPRRCRADAVHWVPNPLATL